MNGGNLEEGQLRCDANVSLRRASDAAMGVPVEVKNLNSFRYVERALNHEVERQAACSMAAGVSTARRGCSTWALDAPSRCAARNWLTIIGTSPSRICRRYRLMRNASGRFGAGCRNARRPAPAAGRAYGLSDYDAGQMAASPATSRFFEAAAAASGHPKAAVNWISGEVTRTLKQAGAGFDAAGVTPEALAGLIRAVEEGRISGASARPSSRRCGARAAPPMRLCATEGLTQIDDEVALARGGAQVMADHPKPVAQFRAGKKIAFGFLVGQVMKATGGQANPERRQRAAPRRELEQA